MKSLPGEFIQIRKYLSDAYELAAKQQRPTDQIVSLQRDLDALENLIGDQLKDLVRKMAEVEAGSRGQDPCRDVGADHRCTDRDCRIESGPGELDARQEKEYGGRQITSVGLARTLPRSR